MSSPVELSRSLAWPRLATFGLIAIGAVGCSADTTRFNENPFSSPYAQRAQRGSSGEVTSSVAAAPPAAAPVRRVESQPLPQPSMLPPPSQPASVASSGSAGGGRGLAAYHPQPSAPEVTGSVQTPPAPRASWDWNGGTAVVVGAGDTLDSISRKHGVPAAVIMQANGLSGPVAVRPGQRLVIPRYSSSVAQQPSGGAGQLPKSAPVASLKPTLPPVAPAAAPKAVPMAGPGVHVVAPGETLITIARKYGKSLTEVASANKIAPHTRVAIGDRLTIPGARTASAVPTVPPRKETLAVPAQQPQAVAAPTPQKSAALQQPVATARVASPAAETPEPEPAVKTAEPAGGLPQFRWPARGRVITGFGPKPNGQQNDGINLAVPEGTPIKAAEDGVVAYAGNELKGYGNLVLVRHANGYVTAYAHASEISVKRNDTIRRGQVIGRAGQTGSVSSPQLHFEIRKGATPVDPMQFLNGT